MNRPDESGAKMLRLRQLRRQLAEREMAERRREFEQAASTLAKAESMQTDWNAAAQAFRDWTQSSAERVHRLMPTIDARREDFARGSRQAQEYVDWCRTQSVSARERLAQAQRRWARERAVCEALEQRQSQTDRRWRAVREEAAFEETADSLASAARARQR